MSTDTTGRAASVGLAFAVVSALSFGLSGPFAKALIDAGWSSAGTALVRIGGSAVVVLLLLAVLRPGVVAAVRHDAPALLLYGLLAMAGVQVAFFNAVRYMPVSIALLLEYLGPVLVIAWVWVVRRQPPSRRTLLGAGIAIVGLLLVVQIWSGTAIAPAGLAWGLTASVCQASYFLLADRAGAQTPPLVLAGVGMAVGTVVVAVLGAVGLLPIVLTTPAEVVLAGTNLGWVVTAALLVLVSTVLAYLTGIFAIRRIGAARGSLVALLEVVVSALAGWLLLGEVPAVIQLAGGALILLGVALTRPRPETLPETL
ncbi:EamA family transporter [Pseudonocardia oroxyli]|uniref:Threonine/homoserine efflux transporter RhtA n=1 Tax=Pseudonocardia oroxyli TaxID=366584 RepID=A0A1G8A109_PSEOR|nr:DMT family transporter [Pseudonocardia oroxyli]SDH14150.1 Threonine/homoserine efflux transporter RhtA [Pseudonocardia oroxyli]